MSITQLKKQGFQVQDVSLSYDDYNQTYLVWQGDLAVLINLTSTSSWSVRLSGREYPLACGCCPTCADMDIVEMIVKRQEIKRLFVRRPEGWVKTKALESIVVEDCSIGEQINYNNYKANTTVTIGFPTMGDIVL